MLRTPGYSGRTAEGSGNADRASASNLRLPVGCGAIVTVDGVLPLALSEPGLEEPGGGKRRVAQLLVGDIELVSVQTLIIAQDRPRYGEYSSPIPRKPPKLIAA